MFRSAQSVGGNALVDGVVAIVSGGDEEVTGRAGADYLGIGVFYEKLVVKSVGKMHGELR